MAFTKTETAARFALQMAEQSRKFGARVAELRHEQKLEQKDLVARMVDLGDKGINTNQVSRYEGGEGPMPRESRLEAFAAALGTDVADLLAGPVADRKPVETPGDFAAMEDSSAQLDRIEATLAKILQRLPEAEIDTDLTDAEDAADEVAPADDDAGSPGHKKPQSGSESA